MRLEQFNYLIEIHKHTSMSAAAQTLHLSSQALSKSITAMEDELGYTLLERSYKGVQLTPKGLLVTEAAKHFFAELAAINGPSPPKPPVLQGQYSLPSIQGEVNQFSLALLTTLSHDFPLLEIASPRHQPAEIERLVQSGESDLGMYCTCTVNGHFLRPVPDDLLFTPLLPCKLFAVVPSHFPLAVYKSISIKSLLPYPLIMQRSCDEQPPFLLPLVNAFGEPKQIIIKPSSALCQELVAVGMGIYLQISLQGKLPTLDLKQIAILSIRDDIQISFGYITAKDRPLQLATDIILQYIHAQAEEMSVQIN